MEIKINENKPEVQLSVRSFGKGFMGQKFLIDTGFQGSCVFISDRENIFHDFFFFNVRELPINDWIVVADGRKVKTFAATTLIEFEGIRECVEVRIILAKGFDNPILGMEFLRQNKKELLISFRKKVFALT